MPPLRECHHCRTKCVELQAHTCRRVEPIQPLPRFERAIIASDTFPCAASCSFSKDPDGVQSSHASRSSEQITEHRSNISPLCGHGNQACSPGAVQAISEFQRVISARSMTGRRTSLTSLIKPAENVCVPHIPYFKSTT